MNYKYRIFFRCPYCKMGNDYNSGSEKTIHLDYAIPLGEAEEIDNNGMICEACGKTIILKKKIGVGVFSRVRYFYVRPQKIKAPWWLCGKRPFKLPEETYVERIKRENKASIDIST